ncbi:putative restriction endonuclease [Streptoalloteichus tenebrarius]|uniref:Restriction endonuclease n=1 Tax=Streptoalloteichus tenebrarius (strain ATCC 17920 / DSM 40477 / JCM 4838 / CBS 697.72 / NBRC 16177 / NCIMB 11028 / NRRL B-12390 / A12253. 1 / ISP 5477) TaxID=1933 RepID=A0ABT1HSC0_STRSD|nr:Uma2 family endonuclease [Streptoalloteichus tenebrarius]MCP2258402.1 putative restriction endonuclease [Streptoalloteichus tenebrarius]BFF03570.1 hypothetical protein GCM10020241_52450 [Streptoalloteichus tenebrarius]
MERLDEEGGIARASKILLAVEIVSPGSRRMDHKTKHTEYADAGIRHFWILDLQRPVSLVACHLTEEFGYQDAPTATGTFTTTDPFPVTLNIDRLTIEGTRSEAEFDGAHPL